MNLDTRKYSDSVKKPENIKMNETSKSQVVENTKKELSREKYFRNLEKRFGDIFNTINFYYQNKTSENIFLFGMDKIARIGKNETPQEIYDRMIKEEQSKLKVLLIELQNYKNKNNFNELEKNFLETLELRINNSLENKYEFKLKDAFKNIYRKQKGNVIYYNDDRLKVGMKTTDLDYNKHLNLYKEHIHTGKTEEELAEEVKFKKIREEAEKRKIEHEKIKEEEFKNLKLESVNLNIKNFENEESNKNVIFYFSKNEESINNLKKLGLNNKEIKDIFENYSSFLKKISDLGILGQSGYLEDGGIGIFWKIKFKEGLKSQYYNFGNNTFNEAYGFGVYENFENYNISVLKIIMNSKNKTGKQLESELEKLFVKEKYDKKVLERIDYYLKKGNNSKDYTVKLDGNKLYVYIDYGNYNNVSGHFTIPRTEMKTGELLNGENMKFFGPDGDKHFDDFVSRIRKKGDNLYGKK